MALICKLTKMLATLCNKFVVNSVAYWISGYFTFNSEFIVSLIF